MSFVKFKKYAGIIFVVLCLFVFFYLCPFSFGNSDSVMEGKEVLTLLSKRNVSEIDAKIQEVQDKFKEDANEVSSFSARFQGTVIMGDSLAAGLLEYGIMPDNIVIAARGKRTNNIDEDVQRVIDYAPKAVFMEYGINDLGYTRGNADLYISQYREQIKKIQKALPKTKIYINSLTPIQKAAVDRNPVYAHVDEFNKGLQKLCKELKITYIDNTKTLDFSQNVYEFDGVHPVYAYYPLWLALMARTAGL